MWIIFQWEYTIRHSRYFKKSFFFFTEKEMDVEYIGVDSIKQEVITTDPSIQQDAKLTKEPLIILEDIMHSIKFS